MRYPICLNSNTYNGFSLADAVDGAAQAGIHLIELSAVPGCQHVDPSASDSELDSTLEMLRERALEPIALGGSANLTTPEGRSQFRRNLELGARLGVTYVVTGTGERHGDESAIEDRTAFSKQIAQLAAFAAELDVRMAIETHGANYATGRALLALLREADAPNLAINYDTANTIYYGDTDPYDDLSACLDRVIGIHLKDKAGARDEWNFPAIGDGNTDFQRIAAILDKARGNTVIPLSIEVEFTPAGPSGLDEVNAAVHTSVQTIRSLW